MALTEYLRDLLSLGPHISESDVVYTFLHCLLRDEQDLRKMREGTIAIRFRAKGGLFVV